MRTLVAWSPSGFSTLRDLVRQILLQAKSISLRADGKAIRLQPLPSGSYRADPPGEESRDIEKLIDQFRFTSEVSMSFFLHSPSETLAEKNVRRLVGTLPLVEMKLTPKAGEPEAFSVNLSFKATV